MIDGTAVKEIAQLAQDAVPLTDKIWEQDGERYTTELVNRIPKTIPEPSPLWFNTLTAVADYLNVNRDGLNLDEVVVHVESPTIVRVRSKLTGHENQRFSYAQAQPFDRFEGVASHFGFARWIDTETLIISLQALFEATEDKTRVLTLLGNLTDEEVRTQRDDGVSQTATMKVRAGIAESADVPNPVLLKPFRTFDEVSQPASTFIFRLKKGESGMMGALFEADGGAWRREAMHSIVDWLREEVPGDVQILA